MNLLFLLPWFIQFLVELGLKQVLLSGVVPFVLLGIFSPVCGVLVPSSILTQ